MRSPHDTTSFSEGDRTRTKRPRPGTWRSIYRGARDTATLALAVMRAGGIFWSMTLLHAGSDMRYALRALRTHPGFTLVCVLALGLGIGANAAMFSVTNSVLLRQLPYPGARRMVRLFFTTRERPDPPFKLMSYPDYQDIVARSRSFEAAALFGNTRATLTGSGEPQVLNIARVTASAFPMLGIRQLAGRAFQDDDDRPGAAPVAMLTHAFWQRRFGGDLSVVSRTITLDHAPVTVIGILPPDATLPSDLTGTQVRDAWIPLVPSAASSPRKAYRFTMFARLRPGVSGAQVGEDIVGIARQLAEAYPESNKSVGFGVIPAREDLVRATRPLMLLITVAVALVLLVACANVANLMLARAAGRRQELAIRHAIGASGGAIARSALAESVILACAGGAVGLLLAWYGVRLFAAAAVGRVPRGVEIRLDGTVVGVTAVLCLATGLLFGIIPAWQSARAAAAGALHEASRRATLSAGARRLRAAFLGTQVALTFPLLAAAGLLLNSFVRLAGVPTGLDPSNLTVVSLGLPDQGYPDDTSVTRFYATALERVRAIPAVRYAGATTQLPLNGGFSCEVFSVNGQPDRPAQCAEFRVTTPGYAEAIGVPLLDGRYFTADDRADGAPVVVVTRSMADLLWPGQSALGRQIKTGAYGAPEPWRTVVGVIGDVHHKALRLPAEPEYHVPHAQASNQRWLTLAVRTDGVVPELGNAIRRAVWTVDPAVPVPVPVAMNVLISNSLGTDRFRLMLIGIFATMALALAFVGVYGLAAYAVSERRREIGIRMALGAAAAQVRRLVVRQSIWPVAVGLLAGAPLVWGTGKLVSGFLYGVSRLDAPTLIAVAGTLVAAAWLGSHPPARRATRTDPVETLRAE